MAEDVAHHIEMVGVVSNLEVDVWSATNEANAVKFLLEVRLAWIVVRGARCCCCSSMKAASCHSS